MIGRALLDAQMGEGDPPYELSRFNFCKEFGWTFAEYEAASARDIYTAMEIHRLQSD